MRRRRSPTGYSIDAWKHRIGPGRFAPLGGEPPIDRQRTRRLTLARCA